MSTKNLAILACIATGIIYGLNHIIVKDIVPHSINSYALVMLRILTGTFLFWILGIFLPRKKIDIKDIPLFILCAILGVGINMQSLIKGLEYSTPINSSIFITIIPVFVLVLSGIFLKERIFPSKMYAIALGFVGALILILFGYKHTSRALAPNVPLGNLLFFVNILSFAGYLILVRPLVIKYGNITLMKWLFLMAIFINAPISYQHFIDIEWHSFDLEAIWKILFVLLGTTFLTYLFYSYALKYLKASTLSAFSYLQPAVTIIVSIILGKDSLTPLLILAMVLVFLSLFLASKDKKQPQ